MQEAGAVVAQCTVVEKQSAIQGFARFGLAAKGVVYMLMGALAFAAAFGSGSAGDSRETMNRASGDMPFGRTIIGIVGIGLLAYALWRLYSGIANPDDEKPPKRLLYVGTGLVNLFLALEGIRIGFLSGNADSGNDAPHWTAEVMSRPFGRWLVIAGGAIFGGYGIAQVVRGLQSRLDKHLRLGELDRGPRMWVGRLARLGLAGRGLVFIVIGIFLVKAGLEHDPSEARDLGASLDAIQQQPLGRWLLTGIAAGLFLYGFYNLVRARYRVIRSA